MVFLFIAGYENRMTGYRNEPELMEINTIPSELVCGLCSDRRLREFINERIAWVRNKVTRVKDENRSVI